MIPRNYYIASPAAFASLAGHQYESVTHGPSGFTFGHVDFSGEPVAQAAFEARADVFNVKSLLHPLPAVLATALTPGNLSPVPAAVSQAVTALTAAGVTAQDSVLTMVEKLQGYLGGFRLHY